MPKTEVTAFALVFAQRLEKKADDLKRTNDFVETCDQSFAAEIQHDTLRAVAGTVRDLLAEIDG